MFRHVSWLASALLIISCLGSASCGGSTVASKDAEGPTVSPSATSASAPTPATATPQATPSPETPTAQNKPEVDVSPTTMASPLPGGLAACIGRPATPPNHVEVASQAPPAVISGYARGLYATNADASGVLYVANVRAGIDDVDMTGKLAWSPDGTRVAFMGVLGNESELIVLDIRTGAMSKLAEYSNVRDLKWEGEDKIVLWRGLNGQLISPLTEVPLDGSPPIELAAVAAAGSDFAWSPNAQCYALTSGSSKETDIFDRDGTLITTVPNASRTLWSPDGSELAVDCGNGGPYKTCVWSLGDGQPPRFIGDGLRAAWSPDKKTLAVATWTNNSHRVILYPLDTAASSISIGGESPAFSNDGRHLAFIRDGNVYVRDLSDGRETAVTNSVIPYMEQPTWSPDGSTLLFSFNPGDSDIYMANADGSGSRLLTVGHHPEWSPDGSRVKFEVGEAALGAWGSVYAADFGGGSAVRLGDYSFDDIGNLCVGAGGNSWSPDGKYVVYYSEDGPNVKGGMYLASSDGSGPAVLIGGGSRPNWSPTADEIVFTTYGCSVFTQAAPGGEAQKLANGTSAAWSPRGDLIAYVDDGQVRVIKPDGTGERGLTEDMTGYSGGLAIEPYAPLWALDGSSLVFTAEGGRAYLVPVDNPGPAHILTVGTPESWTPDGSAIVVSRFEDRHFVSYLVDVDGSGERKLVDGDGVDWSPDGSKILFSR